MKAHDWSKFCQLSIFLSDFNKNDGTQTSHPVTRDAYQSWILSSPHAERSHSVAADNGPVVRQDRGQNLHRGVKPSGWRVTVYNAWVSPFHALILSIVPELSQLPIYRASKDHVTLPHPLFAKRPAFLPPPCFTVFFPSFQTHIMHAIWLCTLLLSLTPSLFIFLRSFSLASWFPIVHRECTVPTLILSVFGVDCFVCENHHDGLRSPWCLQCVQVDISTHPHSVLTVCKQQRCLFGAFVLLSSPFRRARWM